LVEALDRPGGQQQPFECVVPDAHARHSDRRAPRGTVARRQKLQLTPGHANDCFSLPGQDRGGAHRTGRPQRCQRAAPGGQSSILGRPDDCVPAGIPDTLQMLENIGTTIADRNEEAARRRTADRRDRFGPDR
jgi:hypothetical protein